MYHLKKKPGISSENKISSNPFDIPLNYFKKLSFSDYISLSEKAYRLCREEIRKIFKDSNLHHVVICNGKVIYYSSNLLGIDRETVENLMKEIGKPCYVFSREDTVEEASMQARFVMFWEESPLLLANPRRNGFVGRNIMFSFNLRVILNSKDYISEVILL